MRRLINWIKNNYAEIIAYISYNICNCVIFKLKNI